MLWTTDTNFSYIAVKLFPWDYTQCWYLTKYVVWRKRQISKSTSYILKNISDIALLQVYSIGATLLNICWSITIYKRVMYIYIEAWSYKDKSRNRVPHIRAWLSLLQRQCPPASYSPPSAASIRCSLRIFSPLASCFWFCFSRNLGIAESLGVDCRGNCRQRNSWRSTQADNCIG